MRGGGGVVGVASLCACSGSVRIFFFFGGGGLLEGKT